MPKGPIITDMEAQSNALRDAMVADSTAISDAQGDAPFGSVPRTARDVAMKFLPTWFVLGMAEDPISVPWWMAVAKAKGPNDTAQLDVDMRAAWEDEEWRREAFMSAPPELMDQLHFLIAVGLHAGKPRPQAKDSPRDGAAFPALALWAAGRAEAQAKEGPSDAPGEATGGRAPDVGTPTGGGYA